MQHEVLREQWVTTGRTRLYTRMALPTAAAPDALPIVCVHAFGTSSRIALPFMRLLAPRHPVYALDLPGHGKSKQERFTLNFADTSATIAAWMDALALPRALFIGHSSGCQTVLHFGCAAPTRMSGAILLAPSLDERTRSFVRQGLRLLRDFPHESPALPFVLARDYWDVGIVHLAQTVRFDLETEFLSVLPQFAVPTAVVCGARDTLVPPSWGRQVARLLPNGRFVEVPGAAHAMQFSAPQRLLTALTPFLAKALPATQG